MVTEPNRIEEVFSAALRRKAGPERTAYLREACRNDAALRGRVEALLAASEDAGEFLQKPVLGDDSVAQESPVVEGPGAVIGRYKLLEKIGEGGMAVVYMAEQQEPIRRKVALKIIKLGMDTRQVIARFEAERQALALMDHPSIAKVLDAGATETGRPYFVMELVQGVSITEYCDKNNLSTKDRLALFLQVCHAVQHAHQKGIIHRDLKPSNVMVTHHDGKPVPKVIDFGIAKATNQRLTEKTLFTRYAHIIGTPAYMSPEQAELSDMDVDTRTDIYSLGVLLYELLTGTTPFSEEDLRKAGYVEMQRIIREQEPVKPSTRIRTAQVAQLAWRGCPVLVLRAEPDAQRPFGPRLPSNRGQDARDTQGQDALATGRSTSYQQVRGDLDWIVMKSLEKDRLRRYETAETLALDIQRHLEHRPVLAHAPSKGYRLHKFLRRHRVQASTILAIMVVAAVAVVAFSLWNRDRVQLAQAEARQHDEILSEARQRFAKINPVKALATIEPILDSKHVGPAARLLRDQILHDLREGVSQCTRRIEADPLEAGAYSDRAHYYDCLHDRARADADMAMWSALQRQRVFWNSCFGDAWDVRRAINLPFDCQLVFSAERPVQEIPVVHVAFGQKGRSEMKLFEIPVLAAALFGIWLLSSVDAPSAQADFVFGQPEKVSGLRWNEWIDCFSYDGLEMYTEGPDPTDEQGLFWLWVRKRASIDKDWGPVEDLGPLVHGGYHASGACISSDGLALYFVSTRPNGYGLTDIYVTTRATRTDPWGQAVNLGPAINSPGHDRMVWVSADNLELYFGSTRPGGYGASDIYVARRATANDPWGAPTNLGPVVNSSYGECYVCLSPDGLLLFFSEWYQTTNIRPGGHGAPDIWMTRRASKDAPWQIPVNLGSPINGPTNDFASWISPDGHSLHFSSIDREGGGNFQVPIIPIVDFNADGKVDEQDLLVMTEHWGENDPLCDIGPFAWGDGVVDAHDWVVLMETLAGPGFVLNPKPHAVEISRDVVLSWTSPQFAQTHDVYLGTSFEAVNSANRSNPRGVLVSKGQTATTYDPPGSLEFSRTCYWRIDEVGPAPDFTIYRGPVLDFTTEAYAYPITTRIIATASSVQNNMDPEKTIDGSGLDQNDGHSTEGTDMWLSTAVPPQWIQYQFDKVYALHELWMWNSNQLVEPYVGFGAKTVKIEYSTDGTTWRPLAGVPEFAQAPGEPGYKANTIINFGGVSAQYVKLTIEKGWGATPSVGLSEVRFFYIPSASAPKP